MLQVNAQSTHKNASKEEIGVPTHLQILKTADYYWTLMLFVGNSVKVHSTAYNA